MAAIAIDPTIGNQSVNRVLQMHSEGKKLPPYPEGHEPGGMYDEQETVQPDGRRLRWLYYDGALLGQVPSGR